MDSLDAIVGRQVALWRVVSSQGNVHYFDSKPRAESWPSCDKIIEYVARPVADDAALVAMARRCEKAEADLAAERRYSASLHKQRNELSHFAED